MKELLTVSSRAVCYLGTDCVIKYGCPESSTSGGQNRVEAATWERTKSSPYASYLAPVLDSAPDGSWLIQKRIDGRASGHRDRKVVDKLFDIAEAIGIDTLDIGGDNIMIQHDGTPIIIDYGYDRYLYEDGEEAGVCGACTYCTQYRHF